MKKLRMVLGFGVIFFSLSSLAQFSEMATGGSYANSVVTSVPAVEEAAPMGALAEAPQKKKEVVIFSEKGIASKYWQPQKTGCAPYRQFNPQAMTAAHKTLKCGSKVKVTNMANGKFVIVTINDRGPYIKSRIIDLSKASFEKIASPSAGLAKVKLEVLK